MAALEPVQGELGDAHDHGAIHRGDTTVGRAMFACTGSVVVGIGRRRLPHMVAGDVAARTRRR